LRCQRDVYVFSQAEPTCSFGDPAQARKLWDHVEDT
jgi:hypothetical protein